MRVRPHAFIRLGNRWVNMALVTDIEDAGDHLIIFLASDMARLAGGDDPAPIDVARRVSVKDAEDVTKIRRWLMLNDVE